MEATVNNLIKALGWSIFHSLWQGALIYIILFAVLFAIPKLSSKLKHNLAFGSLLLMFASFCFTFYTTFEFPSSHAQEATVASLINTSNIQNLVTLNPQPFLETELWFPVITLCYLIGITIQLLVLVSGYQKLKALKKSTTAAIPAEWNRLFEDILVQLKINKPVKFFLSSKVNVPLVIGYFKPVVLFPIALATQLELNQVEAILVHELSHIRRNDYALNLIKTCIETLLFFNPFIWLAGKFIRIEREHACDDLVVKHTGTPLTYAHALLKLELLKDKQAPVLSLAATGTNQHLYQRIKRITNMKTTYINAKQQLIILALSLSTIVSVAWMNPKKAAVKKAKDLTSIPTPAKEIKNISNQIVLKADTDTTKKKKKTTMKYTITDEKGNTKTYNSVNELPDSLKATIFKSKFLSDSLLSFYNSKEWKDNMAKVQENAIAMTKKFESKEWKDQMAKVQENAIAMTKQFESKEWKDQMAKVQENAAAIAKQFNSKEWHNNVIKMQLDAKKYNSPEWKQKVEDLKKLQDSPEYKELKKKFDKDLEDLKKQKGIKEDKAVSKFPLNLFYAYLNSESNDVEVKNTAIK